jgi:hypothetical protein
VVLSLLMSLMVVDTSKLGWFEGCVERCPILSQACVV